MYLSLAQLKNTGSSASTEGETSSSSSSKEKGVGPPDLDGKAGFEGGQDRLGAKLVYGQL